MARKFELVLGLIAAAGCGGCLAIGIAFHEVVQTAYGAGGGVAVIAFSLYRLA